MVELETYLHTCKERENAPDQGHGVGLGQDPDLQCMIVDGFMTAIV